MTNAILLWVFLMPSLCFAQTNKLVSKTLTRRCKVEVAPGSFFEYKERVIIWELEHTSFTAVHTMEAEKRKFYQRDTTYLSIPWKTQDIIWVGLGIPISIRAHKDLLYMIVFDRDSDFKKIRFRYFTQNHNVLSEIDPEDYPKEIATQNLWLRKENGFRNGKPINEIEVTKSLNPEDIDFQSSLTAKIWNQLEKKKEFYEMNNSIDPQVLSSAPAQ